MKKRIDISIEIICFLFILLFVYAALNKLSDVHQFKVQLGKSPLITSFADWMAWLVIGTEFLISASLVFSWSRRTGLYASFCLMTMFTAYIVAILNFSSYIPCSCGGILQDMGWTQHLIFNIFFVVLGAIGVLLYESKPKIAADKEKKPMKSSLQYS